MPADSPASAEWAIWSTTARVVVTDPATIDEARQIVADELAAVDAAASRFRDDSEISQLAAAGGRPRRVSPLLAELVAAALTAAEASGGDVVPTLGGPLAALGYDRDISLLTPGGLLTPGRAPAPGTTGHVDDASRAFASAHGDAGSPTTAAVPVTVSPTTVLGPAAGPATTVRSAPTARPVVPAALSAGGPATMVVRLAPAWRRVILDGDVLTVPAGVQLDLGATAKAHAADRCAALVARRLGTGTLISLGGDIATAGDAPPGGWRVRVQDRPGEPAGTVTLAPGGALATSSTIGRRWRHEGRVLHHVLDPRTCRPAPVIWRTVTVAAGSCLAANTASTASIIRGETAAGWLRRLRLPARLVDAGGSVLAIAGWPPEPLPVVPVPDATPTIALTPVALAVAIAAAARAGSAPAGMAHGGRAR
ncbi:FAD:protein FMN transferase [Pseudofrankia asymbiotica]|uniref:FAD:protein FMN transferase n=1 Tax=Pseudofrankia asymbiotica TaxID=1834516 RepID=UPI0009D6BF82|nr:FAD:protein FMN transferase [Pseudofrankia asymbiotica]